MCKGDIVLVAPSEATGLISALSVDETPVEVAGAGENILITFDKNNQPSMDQLYSGCVLCTEENPAKICEQFTAEIYVHDLPGSGILTCGYQAMFHCHNVAAVCEIESIPHKIHKKTRKRSKVAPPFLRAHDSAIVQVKLQEKLALETFEDCAVLGRFTLRDQGKTVVIGKVLELAESVSKRNNKK